ncbi:PQQ-like beta-propeller repeat protein [Micromonospora sp. PLK6-60]|uniref:outer membrane protein assembly factor BamB family protein n=1 Tax=Micromonospora sp. PLK6-60 TaxID=2873383 RepID=UPI001CA74FEA|nr:PQQ-binding-like beta-propeller repeat protein [Micromonospora sp. PLK6-60]MBY8871194.1 PQQ-like beta-propeller repeat protein [Micromonospora sp. PLK6-60]
MSVIELGELRHGDEPDPEPRRPAPPTRSGRAVLLAILALLTLAASAPPAAGQRHVTITGPGESGYRIADGRLFVSDGPSRWDGTSEVVAYRLPDGARLWRLPLPRGEQPVNLTDHASTLLVLTRSPGTGELTAVGVDPATGRVRWRQAGYPLPARDGVLLFEDYPSAGGAGLARAIDAGSGALRWSRPIPVEGLGYEFGADGVDRLALIGPGGRVQVLDAGSGAVLRTGRVPVATLVDGQRSDVVVAAGLLLINDPAGTLTAYGLDRLDRRWSLPPELNRDRLLEPCGDGLCLRTDQPGLRMIDPATGRERWRADQWRMVWPVGDRLLVAADGEQREADFVVLDQRTGRRLAALGRWRLSASDPTRYPLIGLRRLDGGAELMARLDVATGSAELLDTPAGEWDGCANDRRALVCQQPDGTLGIWRLDR